MRILLYIAAIVAALPQPPAWCVTPDELPAWRADSGRNASALRKQLALARQGIVRSKFNGIETLKREGEIVRYAFGSVGAKEKTLKKLAAQLAGPGAYPILQPNKMETGHVGVLPQEVDTERWGSTNQSYRHTVLQVVDERNAIINMTWSWRQTVIGSGGGVNQALTPQQAAATRRTEPRRGGPVTYWIRLEEPHGWRDDKNVSDEIGGAWLVKKQHTYQTAIGGSATIPLLIRFEDPDPPREAAASRDTDADAAPESRTPLVRTWTSADGKYTVEATLAGMTADSVRLRKESGDVVTVPLDRLSKEDRQAVADYREERGS